MSNKKFETFKFLTLITQIGLTFVISVLMCMWIGDFLAKLIGADIIKIIFIIIGVLTGFFASGSLVMNCIRK